MLNVKFQLFILLFKNVRLHKVCFTAVMACANSWPKCLKVMVQFSTLLIEFSILGLQLVNDAKLGLVHRLFLSHFCGLLKKQSNHIWQSTLAFDLQMAPNPVSDLLHQLQGKRLYLQSDLYVPIEPHVVFGVLGASLLNVERLKVLIIRFAKWIACNSIRIVEIIFTGGCVALDGGDATMPFKRRVRSTLKVHCGGLRGLEAHHIEGLL